MNRIAEELEFDDVLIRPIPSGVCSREWDIGVKLSDKLILKFPLIASPMAGVVDGKFAKLLSDLGGMAIFHRFYKTKNLMYKDIQENIMLGKDTFGISVRVSDPDFEYIIDRFEPNVILVDTANGYTASLNKYCSEIKNYISKSRYSTLLMAGNVVTKNGCLNLYNSGCDIIRVGIGGGSPCSTRNQTGIGIPNISALKECDVPDRKFKVVIDGGIKNSGDFVKSIVAGADCGMAGKLFAECFEAPNDGFLLGMASEEHMENTKAEVKSIEGFSIPITKKHSLAKFVRTFGYGIKSAGTYLNADSLDKLYYNGEFVKVTDHAIKKGL